MSPSEDDLRAALRYGEGDGPDAARIVGYGQAARSRRRGQVRSGVAVAAVVAAVGVSGVLLHGGQSEEDSKSSTAGGAVKARPSSAAAASSGAHEDQRAAGSVGDAGSSAATAPSPAAGTARAGCPASPTRVLLPGGGSPGQFGAGGRLFAEPVTSVVVCAYGSGTSSPGAHRTVLTGASARELVASLENARTRPPKTSCAGPVGRPVRSVSVVGTTLAGKALRPVTTTVDGPPCAAPFRITTNGTAVRYGWNPPADLAGVLAAPPASASGPHAQGSPVRS